MIQKMITDRELQSAAAVTRASMLNALPKDFETQFPATFDQRMEALTAAEKKRSQRQQVRRRAVAAAVALFLVISTLLSFRSDVRAAVSGWFKKVFDTYTEYWFTQKPIDTLPEGVTIKIPEGYDLIMEDISENRKAYLYQKDEDTRSVFSFEYGKLFDGSPLEIFLPTNQFVMKEVSINGLPGDLYTSLISDESHGVVWIDEKNGIYYSISAFFAPELLLELAETVEIHKN